MYARKVMLDDYQPGCDPDLCVISEVVPLEIIADGQQVKPEFITHSQVAEAVLQDEADFRVGVLAAAHQFILDFIPLFEERFDLVVSEDGYRNPLLAPVFETIFDINFRQAVSGLEGYDTTHTGEKFLPNTLNSIGATS